MKSYKSEILVTVGKDEWIVRVVANDEYKGEALAQVRMFESRAYAYVAERNVGKLLVLLMI